MAAEEGAKELLARLGTALALEVRTKDEAEQPAKVLAGHSVDARRKQKWLCSQLQVVKFLQEFLEQMDSAPCARNFSEPAVRREMAEAKQQWKALKARYQEQVEALQGSAQRALAQREEVEAQLRRLEEALQRLQRKKQERETAARGAWEQHQKEQEGLRERQEQLERRVAELQGKLRAQQEALESHQGELVQHQHQADRCRGAVQRSSEFCSLMETLQRVRLVSASDSDLEVELISEPHHLRVTLHRGEDDQVTLQSDCPMFSPAGALSLKAGADLYSVLLELQSCYLPQAALLAEIQALQGSFAIDWQPQERHLRFLTRSSICILGVEPGYPAQGGIRLLSVQGPSGTADAAPYRPPQPRPSLSDWLEYLSTVEFGGAVG